MIAYTALEKFDSSNKTWLEYKDWAAIPQLKEIVSLDCSLCPTVVEPPEAEDWDHYIDQDIFFGLFKDLEYLICRVKDVDCQIVAVSKEPSENTLNEFCDRAFKFIGLDLVDPETRISALVNCGGFPEAFKNDELNEYGLIYDLKKAKEIQVKLREKYPDEHHADCDIWAVWKMTQ